MVAIYPNENQLPFLFSATINASQKGKVSETIESSQRWRNRKKRQSRTRQSVKRYVYKNHQIEISKAETDRETYLFSVFMEEKEK